MVTETRPVVAEELAVNVSVVEHVGVQCVGEKFAVTLEGRPDAEKVTSCPVPVTSVAVIVVVVVDPCATVPLVGEAERE